MAAGNELQGRWVMVQIDGGRSRIRKMAERTEVVMDVQGIDNTRYRSLFIVVSLQLFAWITILCVFRLKVVLMTAFVPGITYAIGRSMINDSIRTEDHMGEQFMRVIACGLSGGIIAVAITLAFAIKNIRSRRPKTLRHSLLPARLHPSIA